MHFSPNSHPSKLYLIPVTFQSFPIGSQSLKVRLKRRIWEVLADRVALKVSTNFKLEFLTNENEHFNFWPGTHILKYSVVCCWLCWIRKILVLCGRDQGTVEVVNIFCLTHCLLCSYQNVFGNIQIHSSQIISTSYLYKKVFFKTMDIIFNLLFWHFCEIKILLSHNVWNMQTNSFLLPRLVSVCSISMFLCQQKCRQKSDWMYASCTPEPHQSSQGRICFPSIYYHLLLFTGNLKEITN